MISVIIITKNRDHALQRISLPSLLRQDFLDFEIILWDASDSDKSEEVARNFEPFFAEKGISCRFFRAPRHGSPSQRNDAAAVARGNTLFFIDDDSEVSPDGLNGLNSCFSENPLVMGAGLRVEEVCDAGETTTSGTDSFKKIIYRLLGYQKKRKVFSSGSAKGITVSAGPAEWLSGCSMAFRREVFEVLSFNEKLQAFGGYAMCEDVEFSHHVFLHYGYPLQIARQGHVRHHEVSEARAPLDERRIAMIFYNRYILMRLAAQRGPLRGRIGFTWNMMRRFISMCFRHGIVWTFKGSLLALQKAAAERSKEQ